MSMSGSFNLAAERAGENCFDQFLACGVCVQQSVFFMHEAISKPPAQSLQSCPGKANEWTATNS